MVAPALGKIGQDLGITQEVELSLTLSIFVLAYAIGPLFLGPLSEIYGRVIILQLSNLFFLAWNIACGFAQTQSQLIAFRFLSGLGGSAPLALGGGVLSDCWHAEERGKAISIYSLAPLLGPAVGPIAGGFIAMKVSLVVPPMHLQCPQTDRFADNMEMVFLVDLDCGRRHPSSRRNLPTRNICTQVAEQPS
jgi:MFS family permease